MMVIDEAHILNISVVASRQRGVVFGRRLLAFRRRVAPDQRRAPPAARGVRPTWPWPPRCSTSGPTIGCRKGYYPAVAAATARDEPRPWSAPMTWRRDAILREIGLEAPVPARRRRRGGRGTRRSRRRSDARVPPDGGSAGHADPSAPALPAGCTPHPAAWAAVPEVVPPPRQLRRRPGQPWLGRTGGAHPRAAKAVAVPALRRPCPAW